MGVHEAERARAQPTGATPSELDRVLDAALGRLLDLQAPGGWWVGELESNVTMTAQHVFLLHFLRRLDERTLRGCANELLARQRPDGTWAIYRGGEPDLAATVEAYAALRLAGLDPDDPRLAGARDFVLERGGIGASRVFTRMWLALLGQWRWEDIPQIPVELVALRSWMPFSIYDFACWARQTLVPLSIAMHYRPVRPVPAARRCDELNLGVLPRRRTPIDWGDALLTRYQNGRVKPGRERALELAERWILDRQELDGSWGGIQPPWVWSLVALVCRGHGPDSPYLRRGIAGWRRFMVEDGERIRPEACQSPVWDTGLAVLGLLAAGVPPEHPPLVRAVEWLRGEEVRTRSDWSLRRPGATAGGWSFEFDNDLYPDVDDAAVAGGFSDVQEAHFATRDLDLADLGLSYQVVRPNRQHAFGHRHKEIEEVYVVVGGSGTCRLDDEDVPVKRLDAIRVAPSVTRGFAASAEGLELLVFSPSAPGDAEIVESFFEG